MTMNWVVLVWGMVAAACLTLALVHLLAWSQNLRAMAPLAFSIAATSVAACAAFELAMMLTTNPEQFNRLISYGGLTVLGIHAGLVGYVLLDFKTGNFWLGWSSVALRLLASVAAFTTGGSDIYSDVTEVGTIDLLNEQVSVVASAVGSPWAHLSNASSLLWVIFIVDASLRLWRQGGTDNRRRAGVVGGSMVLFLVLAAGLSALQEYQFTAIPYFISLSFLPMIVVIALELGRNLSRVAALAEELRESEASLSLAAELAGVGLWSMDAQGNALWLTERAREIFGFEPGKPPAYDEIRRSWHPDERERLEKIVMEALNSGSDVRADYRVINPDGEIRWVSSRGRPYADQDGKPRQLMGSSVDITVQKHAAEEVLRHDRELAHMSRVSLVGELSGALVHELGQPLGAVLANAETARLLLEADVPDRDELRAILTDIQDDSVRAGQIIHGMRTFLKQQEIEFQPLDVARLFAEVEKLSQPDATQRRTTLTFHAEPGLPSVQGHRVQMQQVILNLILNGLQAMEDCAPDERTLHVAATVNDHGQLDVSVEDRGRGLPADKLDQVFKPFLTTKATGLGMGLSICRRIVQAHGGRIWIENNSDAGATAHVILPLLSE